MADMEKITINIAPVDLGRIDVLVEEGFYQNRSDLIRAAIRRELDQHEAVLAAKTASSAGWSAGVVRYSRTDLERMARESQKVDVSGTGSLIIEADVPASLVEWVFGRVKWYGTVDASPAVRRVLDRKRN
ncbi:MAG: ribbon-helix-helix protein, CopG family [Bacillota bacterium]|nr:ribbon-helix-helix protein, CopG family [Bacillota bacterium]